MGGSFLGKQFSFATGKAAGASSAATQEVISTQPTPKAEPAYDARSETSSTTSTLTGASMSVSASSAAASHSYGSSKPTSSVLDTFEQDSKYKPVTNFEPQERVNPFDKGALKSSPSASTTIGSASTSSSSSVSSSSISSRINRNGNALKSPPPPPPPTGPPPPPPLAGGAGATNNTTSTTSSTYRSSSISGKPPSYNYGSSTSIDTTRMDTAPSTSYTAGGTATATAGAATNTNTNNDTSGIGNMSTATSATGGPAGDWKTAIGLRSASVYSAPAAVHTTMPGDTSGYASNLSQAGSNAYNNTTELPSYTRPSYSRSESNGASKQTDLDIIFGDTKPSYGNGKFSRAGGSLSDAEMIFGGPPSDYKNDRFGVSKSMSVTSERQVSGAGSSATVSYTSTSATSYRIYEGIQNAAFSDYSDSPTTPPVTAAPKAGNTTSNISYTSNTTTSRWNKNHEDDDELDLK